MRRNIIVKICEWFFITVASLMATMAGIVGDYFVMVWIIFGIIVVSANTCLEKLIDERDEVIIEQAKKIGELTEICNTLVLVENNNELEEENKALLNEMDYQSLSDSKQENTENK
jgi:hypothetical protein